MLKANFPVYALRQNMGRIEEPPYLLITTHYNRYILDMPMLQGNYWERRLAMMSMELDYAVYPLKERFTNIAQILRSKRTEFIDSDGKLWAYKKTRSYKLKSYPILATSTTWNGKNLLHTRAGNFVSYERGAYLTLIETSKGKVLFEVSNEPTTRKWIKI